MSKADQLRALREARFDRDRGTVQTPVQKKAKAEKALAEALAGPPEVTQACGAQGIGGKVCIREAGHTEKNHKYAPTPKPGS